VLLWFAGLSVVFVWWVFRSPALDYRLVMLGSVLPLGEAVLGGPRVLHTLVLAVVVMLGIMVLTQRRRLLRRRLIGLPIGLMMHLVLDGVWSVDQVFWWPFLGFDFGSGGLPELERGAAVLLLQELVGAVALVWFWHHFELGTRANRDRFLRTGHLPRDQGPVGTC
jgi:hypothetical protein